MRTSIAFFFCLTLAAGASLVAGHAVADPLGDPSSDTPIMPDPVPNPHQVFAKGLATADIGVVSPALIATPGEPKSGAGCSALNPCAVAPPALDHVDTDMPKAVASRQKKKSVS